MTLSQQQVGTEPLRQLASDVCKLLITGKYEEVSVKFGYAVSLGRIPSAAIQEDLENGLAASGAPALDPNSEPAIEVKYLDAGHDSYALAECELQAVGGGGGGGGGGILF